MERAGVVQFRDFELDVDAFELYRNGTRVPIHRKPLDVLAHLVRSRNRVVSKEELLEKVWSGISVSEHALTSALRDLRRALEDEETPHIIVTVRARGYRFAAAVREKSAEF